MKKSKAEAFLKEKGVSLHSVRATRLPHKYKNEELELIPLMEQFGEECFNAAKEIQWGDNIDSRKYKTFKDYLDE